MESVCYFMSMGNHYFTKKLKDITTNAISRYGTYTFNDKGPSEIIDISELAKEFKALNLSEKIQVVKELISDSHENRVMSDILVNLNEKDEISDEDLRIVIMSGNSELQSPFNSDFLNNTVLYQSWQKNKI